ncbi:MULTISPECIES: acyl carrier protein [Streptomyces]|uniref:Coronafacic acid synthetase n=2 Tax=Streptomyces TaxID=1883 RepID=A0A2N8PGG5_STRNR|nr:MULTISPECIES: acyl carrier protein [Streptomyces]PNE40086.1 coronafacic acid synthetase [Streptomyces noursei]QRX89656.1 acyl carrier protein [Streptomyces noursei]SHL34770.1 acyl carrier protein [Streptomyces yunnanensis]
MNPLQTIKRILHSDVLVEVPIDQMRLNDSLRESYGMDSLGFVELRVQCEEAFDINIPDEAVATGQLSTLGDVLALVERLSGAVHPPATT